MQRVAIIAGSACNLPPEIVDKYGIQIVPVKIVWNEKSLDDGIDITAEEFYERLETEEELPTTSGVVPEDFLSIIDRIADRVDSVVAVLLSSDLSVAVDTAQVVRSMDPAIPIHVVDTRTAAGAQGLIVFEAAKKAKEGASAVEVVARAEEMINKVTFLLALESLEHMRRGGRIGAAAAFLGAALKMKPIIGIRPGQGSIDGIAKPRSWPKAVEKLLDLMKEDVGRQPLHAIISHSNRPTEAEKLLKKMEGRFNIEEVLVSIFTPAMGIHTGPALALCYWAEDS
jgi:DegV family protein with EDD domain